MNERLEQIRKTIKAGFAINNEDAKFLLETIDELIEPKDKISLCGDCYCMTKTVDGKCGKCKGEKKIK